MRILACVFAAGVGLTLVTPVVAQPVPSRDPSSTHIFPAGGQRGTVVPVRVGGECLPPETGFRVWGDGVSAPAVLGRKLQVRYEPSPRRQPNEVPISYPKEWESTIEIAADAPLGPVGWRLTCARGGSTVRPFIVGDLPEFIETESNSEQARAERISLPVTVNGQIAGERDMDWFVFSAKAGDIVTCDVLAGRIASPLDPVVELRNVSGRRVPVEEIRVGGDPVLAFRSPEDGDYFLLVSNVSFHGGPDHVYRVTVSTAPYVAFAFPPGGQVGQTRDVQFFALSGTGTPQVIREPVSFESGHTGEFWYRGSARGTSPMLMVAGDLPDVIETEENNSADAAMPLALPVSVNGQFSSASDEDWFGFTAEKDQPYTITCRAFPAGGATLPTIAVLDAQGAVLAQAQSVDSPDREIGVEWRAPQAGSYRLRLRDLQHGIRGGPEFIYRLSIRSAEPDFALSLKTDNVNVMPGAKTELEVVAKRVGGFAAPIDLVIEGLPAGVRVEQPQIAANQNSVKLALIASDDTRPGDGLLRIVGRTAAGDRMLERPATVPRGRLGAHAVRSAGAAADRLHLTVQHKPVFRLFCTETYRYAHRGTIYPYAMEVERLGDFNGEIVLQLGDRQNRDLDGIEYLETVVPSGVTETKLPIYLPETMHINVQSQSQVYAQGYAIFQDKWGQQQSVLVVSEKRNLIRPLPTVVKLKAVDPEVLVKPGATVRCRLQLDRTANFSDAMQAELFEPIADRGFTADKVRIGPGETSAEIVVRVSETAAPVPNLALKFRAVGQLAGDATVVTEASLPVRFEE